MSEDTQWPRFEVFQQSREGGPVNNVGSVHAPDPEIALQNARDVFVRRPQTVRLWVAPATSILMKTREELENDPEWREELVTEKVPPKTYHIFCKTSQRRAMTYVSLAGDVEAPTPVQALAKAQERFGGRDVFVWWVVPALAVIQNEEEDADTLFKPAHDKTYRLPGEYHTRTLMREATSRSESDEDQG